MRHRRSTTHLSRNAPHARLMLRNLATSVFTHQQIQTTLANAKAVQPFVERLITLGKAGDLHARRRVIALLGNETATRRLFKDLVPLFASRQGGYTRIIRLGNRRGDGANLALLELTERIVITPPAAPKKRGAKAAASPDASAETAERAPAAPSKSTVAPTEGGAATPPPQAKPRKLFDGLRKLWGRQGGDRGGKRG